MSRYRNQILEDSKARLVVNEPWSQSRHLLFLSFVAIGGTIMVYGRYSFRSVQSLASGVGLLFLILVGMSTGLVLLYLLRMVFGRPRMVIIDWERGTITIEDGASMVSSKTLRRVFPVSGVMAIDRTVETEANGETGHVIELVFKNGFRLTLFASATKSLIDELYNRYSVQLLNHAEMRAVRVAETKDSQ